MHEASNYLSYMAMESTRQLPHPYKRLIRAASGTMRTFISDMDVAVVVVDLTLVYQLVQQHAIWNWLMDVTSGHQPGSSSSWQECVEKHAGSRR
jgi:hypothetical protein